MRLCRFGLLIPLLREIGTTAGAVDQKPAAKGETYNYAQVMYLSLLFYEAQRSGKLPKDNRIPWRTDAYMEAGQDVGRDLTGGWFDAGDYMIFGFPMAYSTTTLAWGLLEYWDAWQHSGELVHMLDAIRWPLDWLLKAHVEDDQFFVQIGDGATEHAYWGRPDQDPNERPAFRVDDASPGSEPAAEAAAALAAGFLVFHDYDSVYASELLDHSRRLFDFALQHQAKYTVSDPFYPSYSGFKDELAWAAVWLYKATGQQSYLDTAVELYGDCCTSAASGVFGWDFKAPGVQLLLFKLTKDTKYSSDFAAYMEMWFSMKTTPKGLAFYQQWGPLRYAANTAFLALVAADCGLSPRTYRSWARSQIHYMLGDCCGGVNPKTKQPRFSYVIGYGDNFPRAPHHRAASCGPQGCSCGTTPHPNILYGAMVGGPGQDDSYQDDCQNYQQNEVATDYNAGLTSAIAALKHLSLIGQLSTF